MPTPDLITEWIESFGFTAKPVDVESPDEWGFLLSDNETEHTALVAFRGDPFPQLSLQTGVEVSREALEEKGSGAIGGRARTAFLQDLRLRLLLLRSVTSRFAVKPAEGGGFERIQIMFETRLMEDQISRASFYERYMAIQSAVVTAWTMFDKFGTRGEWS